MKRILSGIFALLLVFSVIFINYSYAEANKLDIYDYDAISNLMKKDKMTSPITYSTYSKVFSFEKEKTKEKTFEYDEYRDDYAGSFVKDGKLNILKTNNTNNDISNNRFLTTYNTSDSLSENIVRFSMNQLNETMNDINLYKKYKSDTYIAKQFNFYWIDIENNRIVIEFNTLNDKNINLFKQLVSNRECIIFKQVESEPKEEVSVYSGSKIVIGSSSSSVGYRATKNGVKGLVISGHAGEVGSKVYKEGTLIGTVESKKNSGSVDAAFVKTNNSTVLSNSVYGGVLSNNLQNMNVGVEVMKRGFSTGVTSGRVTKSNVSVTFNGVSFFGLVGASYGSQPGDSGALIFFKVPGENLINTVGIHKGRVGQTKIYSKAKEVNKALKLKRY